MKLKNNFDFQKLQFEIQRKMFEFQRFVSREKEGDLTQSCDEHPYTNRKFKSELTTQKAPQKTSITQRLWTDLGLSVGVTTVIQLLWLNRLTVPNLPTNRKSCIIKRTHNFM